MYCQSCGAQNTNDAKFCNQCGTQIARPGDAGGPLPGEVAGFPPTPASAPAPAVPAAPIHSMPRPSAYDPDTGFGGPSMLNVSLASIGVRSSKKTWLILLLVALLLVALGALGSWLARGEPEVITEAGHANPDDPFVIGTPLPGGEETPGVDFVSGSHGGAAGMRVMEINKQPETEMSPSVSMTTTAPIEMREPSTSSTMRTPSRMTTPRTTTSMQQTSMETASSETMSTPTMTPSTSAMTSVGSVDEEPEDRDLEMELYSSRVRFVIRRYYAARAQACFERATRNSPTVSGTVVVTMTINAEGQVSRSRTTRNTTGDADLGRCLQAQVSTWRLPPPPGGELEMQMPFSR